MAGPRRRRYVRSAPADRTSNPRHLNPDISAAFNELERRREGLLERLAQYPEPRLRHRPQPNTWSLLDVAEHLMRAERATLESIMRSATRTPLVPKWYDRIMNILIARTLDSAVRIPVTGRILTPEGLSLPELAERWGDVHASWRSYLSTDGADPSAIVFRHPLGAVMTRAGTLAFLRRHFDHHLHQVERVERSWSSTR